MRSFRRVRLHRLDRLRRLHRLHLGSIRPLVGWHPPATLSARRARGASALGALSVLVALAFGRSARADLLINEALSAPTTDWNGDGTVDFKNDEWVEILNTGPGVESLDGVFLRDGTGPEYHYGFTGALAPGEARVVYGHESVAWQTDNGLSTVGLSLNNGGDTIELWRDQTDPVVLQPLDVVIVPAHAAANQRALGRDPVTLGWLLFDALNPYTGTLQPGATGCTPSPGQVNECGPSVPGDEESWGSIKVPFAPTPPRP